jgi:hypothetical protein
MDFHFCGVCGCMTHSVVRAVNAQGRHRVTVNLRLAEPEQVGAIPVRHFDGFDTWAVRPEDGRTVADMWF